MWVQLASSHSLIPRELQGVNNSKELSHLRQAGQAFVLLCQTVTDCRPPLGAGGELSGISLKQQLSGVGNS